MQTSYRLNARDLDQRFLDSLKTLFPDQEIEIVVYKVDETSYINQSPANQERLLAAMTNVERNNGLIEVELDSFE
ncbi:MAG: hypothetical protein AAGF24_13190 [Cyanobacteria bacterium P01_H01_bin.121]